MPTNDKFLDLKEARRDGKLAQFIRERRSVGNETMFDKLLRAMAKAERGDGQKPATKGRNR